ncbi:hypothetical protein EDC52_104241 [Biostraticola tofi]|uniref:Virulence factor VirK n=2 Tax=Biostraticola tofi TaxID=466109 RepID=A0A4R3YVW1_9GAMM|nr:hypothetical protein EDC52_104241 [Biostraticola tofi]
MVNTAHPMSARTAASLFFHLICGTFVPDKLWLCRRFRTKFLLRSLLFPATTFRFLQSLARLPSMGIALDKQGLLPAKIHRPYLLAGLSVSARARALTDHYQFTQSLKNPALRQLLQAREEATLVTFTGKNGEYFDIGCCSGHFDREGEVTLVVKYNDVTLAALSFSVIQKAGLTSVVIGGLQGPRKDISNDIIREATKASFGLFPKRVLMEVLFILAGQCDIKQIFAVSDDNHVFRSLRYRHSKKDHLFASYSDFWSSLHGTLSNDGLYALPLAMPRKELEQIVSKKRSEYRRRYELLDNMAAQLLQTVNSSTPVQSA